jgi:hypothetical protein
MTNKEKMERLLSEARVLYHHWFQELMPEPLVSDYAAHDEPGEPKTNLVDAHWKCPEWEMLLSTEGEDFSFYADNIGKHGRKVNFGDATPKSVALTIFLLKP